MSFGPNTKLYMSVSASPGRFGSTVYAALFERYAIDGVYLPRPAPGEARQITDAIRALSIEGCSVSSPHKRGVIEFLDEVDAGARDAESVNTIVRTPGGGLRGHSTDVEGVVGALRGVSVTSALVFGAGGVVGPTIAGLRRLGAERVRLCARSSDRAADVAARFGIEHVSIERAASMGHGVLVNATPAGRTPDGAGPLEGLLASVDALLDMPVAADETYLCAKARSLGLSVRTGVDMCVHQITAQASLYLSRPIELDVVREIVTQKYLASMRSRG